MTSFGKTVTVTHMVDAGHGDRTPGDSFDVPDCPAWPAISTETVGGQETVDWDLTVLVPPGTDVRSTDTVTVDGTVYEVSGQPMVWESPLTGWQPGIQVLLRTQTG